MTIYCKGSTLVHSLCERQIYGRCRGHHNKSSILNDSFTPRMRRRKFVLKALFGNRNLTGHVFLGFICSGKYLISVGPHPGRAKMTYLNLWLLRGNKSLLLYNQYQLLCKSDLDHPWNCMMWEVYEVIEGSSLVIRMNWRLPHHGSLLYVIPFIESRDEDLVYTFTVAAPFTPQGDSSSDGRRLQFLSFMNQRVPQMVIYDETRASVLTLGSFENAIAHLSQDELEKTSSVKGIAPAGDKKSSFVLSNCLPLLKGIPLNNLKPFSYDDVVTSGLIAGVKEKGLIFSTSLRSGLCFKPVTYRPVTCRHLHVQAGRFKECRACFMRFDDASSDACDNYGNLLLCNSLIALDFISHIYDEKVSKDCAASAKPFFVRLDNIDVENIVSSYLSRCQRSSLAEYVPAKLLNDSDVERLVQKADMCTHSMFCGDYSYFVKSSFPGYDRNKPNVVCICIKLQFQSTSKGDAKFDPISSSYSDDEAIFLESYIELKNGFDSKNIQLIPITEKKYKQAQKGCVSFPNLKTNRSVMKHGDIGVQQIYLNSNNGRSLKRIDDPYSPVTLVL